MKELFHKLIETMPLGILVKETSGDSRYTVCNMSAAMILGKSVEEIVGKTDAEIFNEDIADLHEQQDCKTIQSKRVYCNKVLIDYGYGGIWLKTTQYPLLDENDSVCGIMRILENITEAVQLEQKIHHFQKMEEVGKLAGGVAHEFNNLLQVIAGYSDMINDDTSKESIKEHVKIIHEATKTAKDLTRQLLTFSRKTEPVRRVVNINQLIENSLRMTKVVFDENMRLNFNPCNENINIYADPSQVEQIFMNLCVNSRDAVGANGRIDINVSVVTEVWEAITLAIRKNSNQKFVKIEFFDDGPGIPPDVRPHIFEPFFTTKDIGKGTGLGLATVYAIFKQHHGYIFLDQNYNNGTKFNMYFPVTIDKTIEDKVDVCLSNNLDGKNKTVILAEDEDGVRQMCVRILEKNGFEVLQASNGEEALELYEKNTGKISLLLFDVMMPRMTGKEAYDRILLDDPTIPTLFCTGYSSDLIPADVISRPNVQLLTKPYRSKELLETISNLLNKKKE